jgi:hypothetical protein
MADVFQHANKPAFPLAPGLPVAAFAVVEDYEHVRHPLYGASAPYAGKHTGSRYAWYLFPTERGLLIECRKMGFEPDSPPDYIQVLRADITWTPIAYPSAR